MDTDNHYASENQEILDSLNSPNPLDGNGNPLSEHCSSGDKSSSQASMDSRDIHKEIKDFFREYNIYKQAIKERQDRGWIMFPISKEKKTPLVKWKDITLEESIANLVGWLRGFKMPMFAVKTGHETGLLVIDCDGEEGIANFLALCKAHDYVPDTTYCESTPSGGRHYIYKIARNDQFIFRNTTSVLAPKVDTRGNGGLCITAPSKKMNGARYQRTNDKEPGPLPDFLLDLLLQIEARRSNKQSGQKTSSVKKDNKMSDKFSESTPIDDTNVEFASAIDNHMRLYAQKVLINASKSVEAAEEGKRNNTLYKAAFQSGKYIEYGGLTQEQITTTLLEASKACGLVQDDGESTVLTTIQSGINAGSKNPDDMSHLKLSSCFSNGSKLPKNYFIRTESKKSGIWYFMRSKNGNEEIWLGSEFHIIAKYRDESNEDWGHQLEWKDEDGMLHTDMISYAQFLSRNKLEAFSCMAKNGWKAPSDPKAFSLLLRLFSEYTTSCRVRKITKTGWVGDVFVFPDAFIERTPGNESE